LIKKIRDIEKSGRQPGRRSFFLQVDRKIKIGDRGSRIEDLCIFKTNTNCRQEVFG